MTLLQSFRNLSPRTRAAVGLGLLAWGAIGLQLSDRAEDRFGLRASEADREALREMTPRITMVERGERPSPEKGGTKGDVGNGGKGREEKK
ncbi:hypothetical protein F4778DRAFT_359177 [Xylariomycetidae sp. FL2044]|nr:hypothetical protein F4778DRAFT_359177 [Xylariomycetidae sp. FL2044]